jgi:hypothetical protein
MEFFSQIAQWIFFTTKGMEVSQSNISENELEIFILD